MRRRKMPRHLQGLNLIEVLLFMMLIGMLAYILARPLYQECHQQAKSIKVSHSKSPISTRRVAKSE